jgi:hypothetical protein
MAGVRDIADNQAKLAQAQQASAMARYYEVMAQTMPVDTAARNKAAQSQADAAWLQAGGSAQQAAANAEKSRAEAGAIPADTLSQTYLRAAQGSNYRQQGGLYGAQADVQRELLNPASNSLMAELGRIKAYGDTPVNRAKAGATPSPSSTTPTGTPSAAQTPTAAPSKMFTGGVPKPGVYEMPTDNSVPPVDPETGELPPGWHRYAYKAGTTKVPGKGSGKVDTVPAMLAPGEAVLNKGAAEHMGRDNIKALNAVGLAKMGMGMPSSKDDRAKPQAKGKTAPHAGTKDNRVPIKAATGLSRVPVRSVITQKNFDMDANYAKGTSHVGKGSKKGDTPKMDPKAMAALMGMLGGSPQGMGSGMGMNQASAPVGQPMGGMGGGAAPGAAPMPPMRGYAFGTDNVNPFGTDNVDARTQQATPFTSFMPWRSAGSNF